MGVDNFFNIYRHCDANRVKEVLVKYLDAKGAAKVGDEYRLSLRKCIKCLRKIFGGNLSSSAIEQLFNDMIFRGAVVTKRGGFFRCWVVIIQTKDKIKNWEVTK